MGSTQVHTHTHINFNGRRCRHAWEKNNLKNGLAPAMSKKSHTVQSNPDVTRKGLSLPLLISQQGLCETPLHILALLPQS